MKVLLFLNGPLGWQTGIEDGFNNLLQKNKIDELNFFYFDDELKNTSTRQTIEKMSKLVSNFIPDMIIFFHINKFPITETFLDSIKKEFPNVKIIYDEGDMYGTRAKPITKSMKIIFKYADKISIRGLGKFAYEVRKFNSNIIYTPHHADIARFDFEPYILEKRKFDIVLIGNRIKSRIFFKKRLPGAIGREKFVLHLASKFLDKFSLFGNGWESFKGNKGPIDFQKQIEIYKESWITVAYEHYPNIPYYFSNRLPIALLSGSIYVCHYHEGYENIFKGCDFIYFFKTNEEAVDIIDYIFSLEKNILIEKSIRARSFALKYFTPEIIWNNFFNNINE